MTKEEKNEIFDRLDQLVIASRAHSVPSPETLKMLTELDKKLALLTLKFEQMNNKLSESTKAHHERMEEINGRMEGINKRTRKLEDLKVWGTGILVTCTAAFAFLADWIKSKL